MDVEPLALIQQTITDLAQGFFERLPQIAIAIVVLILTFVIARIVRALISSAMKGAKVRKALIQLTVNLVGIAAWIGGVAIAITVIFPSITPAQLVAGLGLTTVAIGFAFKDVFENFLAGIMILGRKKMRIGDIIECEDVFGRIEDISIRETHVRETDGELVIVPNAYLFQNPLKIQTDQELKRHELVIGVDYDTELPHARDVLQSALDGCSTVDDSKPTEVKCVSFGGSSIDFKLLWWTQSEPREQRRSFDEVAFAVKASLDEADIDIPFPNTTLSFRPDERPISIRTMDKSESRSDDQ